MFSFTVKLLLVILRFTKNIGKSYEPFRLLEAMSNDGETNYIISLIFSGRFVMC